MFFCEMNVAKVSCCFRLRMQQQQPSRNQSRTVCVCVCGVQIAGWVVGGGALAAYWLHTKNSASSPETSESNSPLPGVSSTMETKKVGTLDLFRLAARACIDHDTPIGMSGLMLV